MKRLRARPVFNSAQVENASRESSREHPLSITLGRGLLRIADPGNEYNLLEQLSWLRKEIHRETGLILPGFKVTDSPRLESHEYVVYYQDLEIARGRLYLERFLVTGLQNDLAIGADCPWYDHHPVTGDPSLWLTSDEVGQYAALGCLWFEPFELLTLHLRNTLRQRASLFITCEYANHFLVRALEMDGGSPLRRRHLEGTLPRFHRVLQSLLDLGGDLRDPVHILRTFERALRKIEAPEIVGKRILEQKVCAAEVPCVDNSVAGAMLYSAHWNEMLCLELFPHMDQQQLSLLTSGILTMQHYPGALVEKLWYDIGVRSESLVMGRSNQELADQIRSILSRGLDRPQPLTALEKLAVLLLSLPKNCGPGLSTELVSQLNRNQAGELATYLGRYAPYWSEAPMRSDQRSPLELGLRERVVAEFLDFAACAHHPKSNRSSACLLPQLIQWVRVQPDPVCSVIEQHYFPPVDPVSRFRFLVRRQPRRLMQWMLTYVRSTQIWVPSPARAAKVVQLLPSDLQMGLRARLRSRGCQLPDLDDQSAKTPACVSEFLYYLEGHRAVSERARRQ